MPEIARGLGVSQRDLKRSYVKSKRLDTISEDYIRLDRYFGCGISTKLQSPLVEFDMSDSERGSQSYHQLDNEMVNCCDVLSLSFIIGSEIQISK